MSSHNSETLRLERAATAEKLAREFEAQDGKRRIKRGLLELTRTINSEEARERSKYLDRRIREAAGLDVKPVAGELATVENPDGFNHNRRPDWNAKPTTKRKSEPRHMGGVPVP